MKQLMNHINDWFIQLGLSENLATFLTELAGVIFLLLISIIGFYITKSLTTKAIHVIAKRTKNTWDDILIEKKVFKRLAYLAPALIIIYLTPYFLVEYEFLIKTIKLIVSIYMVIIVIQIILSFINAFNEIYSGYEISKTKPIKGYIQVIKIIIYILAIAGIITILLGKNNFGWIAGFGAFSAVLMLIFKDSILGFVGGITLSANNMVKIGDWIEMPKFGANGTVIDISLTTVKVQNWDKTITTVPTYNLVTDYFMNWRGMEESGGRRIKRSINIDMDSIKFCTPEMLERFKKIQYVAEYVERTENNIREYNKKHNIDNSVLVNGRRQTNIGVFRAYLKGYLSGNPIINTNMTFLVRQLQPNEKGLPIEIYVFSKVQEWAKYEDIQSDIFDHILAVIPQFDLRTFQNPSGADFRTLISERQF